MKNKASVIVIGILLIGTEYIAKAVEWLLVMTGTEFVTGIAYPVTVTDDGVKTFISSRVIELLNGRYLGVEVILVIIGYVLIAAVAWSSRENNKLMKTSTLFCILSLISYIAYKFVSLAIAGEVLLPVLVCSMLLYVVCTALMFYSLSIAIGRLVDTYKYMELEKDLKFAFEMILFSTIVLNAIIFIKYEEVFSMLYFGVDLLVIISVLYFAWTIRKYNKKLHIMN